MKMLPISRKSASYWSSSTKCCCREPSLWHYLECFSSFAHYLQHRGCYMSCCDASLYHLIHWWAMLDVTIRKNNGSPLKKKVIYSSDLITMCIHRTHPQKYGVHSIHPQHYTFCTSSFTQNIIICVHNTSAMLGIHSIHTQQIQAFIRLSTIMWHFITWSTTLGMVFITLSTRIGGCKDVIFIHSVCYLHLPIQETI